MDVAGRFLDLRVDAEMDGRVEEAVGVDDEPLELGARGLALDGARVLQDEGLEPRVAGIVLGGALNQRGSRSAG